MRTRALAISVCCGLLAAPAAAQVVRAKVVAAQLCNGARHMTSCSKIRLISGVVNLDNFVNQVVELRGTKPSGSCPLMQVLSVTRIGVQQETRVLMSFTAMAARFRGTGPVGSIFVPFIGLPAGAPILVPPIVGPFHLNPGAMAMLGAFKLAASPSFYYTFQVPFNPIFRGIDVFDQAVVVHTNGKLETTNLDCFRF